VESGEQDLNDIIFKITGIKVMSFHSDLSTVTGERIIVFKLEDNLEKHI
ncbi:TPA: Na-translocating system protein MpsC family protein, partial [Staphylococcus aureus]